MKRVLSKSEALESIRQWTELADTHKHAPDRIEVTPLCYTLLVQPSIYEPTPAVHSGPNGSERDLVAFKAREDASPHDLKTRYLLPVHFAQMRVYELVPGISVPLAISKERDISRLQLRIANLTAKELGIPARSNLERLLLNAPPDAGVYERRTSDYHFLLPSNSILIRHRTIDNIQTQASWETSVEKMLLKRRRDHSLLPSAVLDVLRRLNCIADRWHWDELLDRLPSDPRNA